MPLPKAFLTSGAFGLRTAAMICAALILSGAAGAQESAETPPTHDVWSLIGVDPAPGPVGRAELERARQARHRRARETTPTREELRATATPSAAEPLPQAPRRWDASRLDEDAERIRELWRTESGRSGESKMRAVRQMLAGPEEPARKADTSSWESIGTGIHVAGRANVAGRIRKAQYVYADDLGYTTLYVGTSGGGIFRFVNLLLFGVWVPLADNLPTEGMVGSFLVDRTNSNRMLIATGDFSRRNGTGVWRTLDGGASWQAVGPTPYPLNSLQLVQDSTNPEVVLLAGAQSFDPAFTQEAGIWRSTNFGTTWTKVHTGVVTDLAQDPLFPQFWLAGKARVGVLESSDGGQTFAPIGGHGGLGLGGASTERISYAISESSPNYHYLVATDTTDGFHGIFRSTDYGVHWTRIDQGDYIGWGQGWHTNAIGVDPENRGVLFVGMGGNQWTDQADAANPANICWRYPFDDVCAGHLFDAGHADQTGFLFVPDTLSPGNTKVIITNDGGYFVYDWTAKSLSGDGNTAGLAISQQWPRWRGTLSSTQADETLFLAGLFDNGVVRVDTDHAQKVRFINGGDGGQVHISPDQADDWFYTYGLGFRRVFSLDAGVTAPNVDCGLGFTDTPGIRTDAAVGFATAMYTHDDRYLWSKPLSTTCNWTRINAVGDPIGGSGAAINYFSQAHKGNEWIFYATNLLRKELYVLQGPAIGSLVPDERSPALPPGVAGSAAAFPDASVLQPETVYYTLDGAPRAYLSTNAGLTWTDVSGNLPTDFPDILPGELVGDPSDLDRLFLGTDVGILRSDDGGEHWYRWMNGLPAVIDARVLELVHDGATEPFVMIGSFGRGFWKRVIDDRPLETRIFADGFESGTTSAWSSP